jgi:hypothetical protein
VGEGEVVIYKSTKHGCISIINGNVKVFPIEHFIDIGVSDSLKNAIKFAMFQYEGDLAIFDRFGNYYPIKK